MLEPYKCCNSDSHLCSGFNTAFRPSFRDVPRQATAMTSIQRPGWPAMWFLVPRCRNHLPRFSVFVWTDIRILENMEKFSEIQKISSELDEVSKFTRYFLKDFGDVVVSGPQVLLHGPSPRGRTRFCKAGLMGWWSMGNWDQHVFFSSGWNNTTWMFWMIPENWMVYIYIYVHIIFLPQILFETVTQSRRWKSAAQPLHVFREFQETPDYHLGVAWGLLRMIIFSSESPIPTR